MGEERRGTENQYDFFSIEKKTESLDTFDWYFNPRSNRSKKQIVVYFVGGVTYKEVEYIRKLQ